MVKGGCEMLKLIFLMFVFGVISLLGNVVFMGVVGACVYVYNLIKGKKGEK